MKPKTFEEFDRQSEHRGRSFVLPFGKYKGLPLKQLLEEDPQYLVWLNNKSIVKLKKKLLKKATKRADDSEGYYSELLEYNPFEFY